jgi:hypothetical protein
LGRAGDRGAPGTRNIKARGRVWSEGEREREGAGEADEGNGCRRAFRARVARSGEREREWRADGDREHERERVVAPRLCCTAPHY